MRTLQALPSGLIFSHRFFSFFQVNIPEESRYAEGMFRVRTIFLLMMLVARIPGAAAGPGLPNQAYPGKSVFDMLTRIDSNSNNGSAPRGHGFVTMHQGYFMVVFSNDGGGGNGTGGFSFINLADPENPVNVFRSDTTAPYNDSSSSQYAGNIREAHGYSFSGNIWCMNTNRAGGSGLQFWDLSTATSPVRLSEIELSGLSGGDYGSTAWWVFWQGGRYAYVAGTTGGLYIVDGTDPSNPVELKRIPTGSLGGFRVNTCFAIGNLLVLAQSDGGGIATFDISDPLNPTLLDLESSFQVGYSMMVNGNRILGAHDPARVYDISNPGSITLEGQGPNVAGKGGYGIFKDGSFYYGSSTAVVNLDVSGTPFTSLGTHAPSGFSNADWDFAIPLGNLLFAGNDHNGSALLVGSVTADQTAPEVNMVNPASGATGQAVTSRVGITLTDQVLTESIDSTTFIVRPLGGSAIAGTYSNQTGIVNFWPASPLSANTTYEVVIPAGGIKDLAGNGVGTTFTSQFTTEAGSSALELTVSSPGVFEVGESVSFTASSSGANNPEYSWNFGDGSPATAFNASPSTSHTYSSPGNYTVTVTVQDGGQSLSEPFAQLIHLPLTAEAPVHSSTIVFDGDHQRVWIANPDNDSVTAISSQTPFAKQLEIPVGDHPRTLALGPNNELWVSCQDEDEIVRIHRGTGAILGRIPLEYGDAPFAVVFSPDQSVAYVSLEGPGEVIRLHPTTHARIGAALSVGAKPRGLALSGDGNRLLVTRFLSPDTRGEVLDVNTSTFTLHATIGLAVDPGPDQEDSGRGLPNYLSTIAISPDGGSAWVPSKKDNIQRGHARDGLPLTFESTVRSIASKIDLTTGLESLSDRVDFNDRDMASAVAFSRYGNVVFITTQGTQTVEMVDAYSSALLGSVSTGGRSPQGLVLSPDGSTLFVHNFMTRSVGVFSVGGICGGSCALSPELAQISTVASETLSAEVLLGKQVFYNAADARMNQDSYISCATCHLDGQHDGRTWDFTDRGEGFRNTHTLQGSAGMAHGRVHRTGNFDEIHDFEHDIRGPFGGEGFLSDAVFHSGNRNRSLGGSKAGFNAELDALVAYVSSLNRYPKSPHRNADGSMTPSAIAGEAIFQQRCTDCHNGRHFTNSTSGVLFDVGTLKSTSGNRLGLTLTGLDTPGLRGVWATGPYLHDGSAATLHDVIVTQNPSDLHGVTSDLTSGEIQNLIDYLRQLDGGSGSFAPQSVTVDPDQDGDGMETAREEFYGLDPYLHDASQDADSDTLTHAQELALGTDPHVSDTDGDGLLDGEETNSGIDNGPSDPGTDPLNADTDSDGLSDGEEVAGGSDPLDPSSPGLPAYLITSVTETNGQVEGVIATIDTDVYFGEDVPAFSDRAHEWNGGDASGIPALLDGAEYIRLANDSRGTGNYTLTVTLGSMGSLYLLWDDRVALPDWVTDEEGLDVTDTGLDVGWDEVPVTAGAGQSIDQTASVYLVHDTEHLDATVLAAGAYEFFERGGGGGNSMYGIVAVSHDRDRDGMTDAYETANGLDPDVADGHLDSDLDGSSNLEEFRRGTSANDDDSDNDGLKDGEEVGTDPLMADSDGDLYSDAEEKASGSNPTHPGSIPSPPTMSIQAITFLPGSSELDVSGLDIRRRYQLWRSVDLVTWEPVFLNFSPASGTDTLVDPSAPAGKAFYHIVVE